MEEEKKDINNNAQALWKCNGRTGINQLQLLFIVLSASNCPSLFTSLPKEKLTI